MNNRILIMAGILVVLAAFTFIVPIGMAKVNLETAACPGTFCVINKAKQKITAPQASNLDFCSTGAGYTCADCCDICSNAERIIGIDCSCVEGSAFSWCP